MKKPTAALFVSSLIVAAAATVAMPATAEAVPRRHRRGGGAPSNAGAQTRRAAARPGTDESAPPPPPPASSTSSATPVASTSASALPPPAASATPDGAPPPAPRTGTLVPGTHPGFVHGALGFSVGSVFGFNVLVAGGYHFFGNSGGPALSGEVQLNIAGGFGMLPGARFAWDIPIGNLPLYLSPSARLGVAMVFGDQVFAAFDIQPAFDVKLVLLDRLMLFARPVGIDVTIPLTEVAGFHPGVGVAYQFLLGAGATF